MKFGPEQKNTNNTMSKNFLFQINIEGQWEEVRQFDSIAALVKHANNFKGYNLSYERVRYHLNRYKELKFDRKNGAWQARFLIF